MRTEASYLNLLPSKTRMKKVFLICPVRGASADEKDKLSRYVERLESQGYKVHYPSRDTDQTDPIGVQIITKNLEAILNSDEVHLFYSEKSQASIMDFGFSYGNRKPIYVVNKHSIKPTDGKSYQNILINLDGLYSPNAPHVGEWKKLDAIAEELKL